MARRLFDEWFMRFKFPGHAYAEFTEAGSKRVPSGWSWGRLSDIVDLKKEATKPGPHLSSRRYLPIECIGRRTLWIGGSLDYSRAQSSLQLFEENDIVFGAMRPYFHKVTVAPFNGITRSTCFVLRPNKSKYLGYAAFLLFHDNTIAYAAAHSKGSTIPYASWNGALADMPVLVPPVALMEKFSVLVKPAIRLVQTMFFTQSTLRAARDFLLPKLISGEIDLVAAERRGRDAATQAAAE